MRTCNDWRLQHERIQKHRRENSGWSEFRGRGRICVRERELRRGDPGIPQAAERKAGSDFGGGAAGLLLPALGRLLLGRRAGSGRGPGAGRSSARGADLPQKAGGPLDPLRQGLYRALSAGGPQLDPLRGSLSEISDPLRPGSPVFDRRAGAAGPADRHGAAAPAPRPDLCLLLHDPGAAACGHLGADPLRRRRLPPQQALPGEPAGSGLRDPHSGDPGSPADLLRRGL